MLKVTELPSVAKDRYPRTGVLECKYRSTGVRRRVSEVLSTWNDDSDKLSLCDTGNKLN